MSESNAAPEIKTQTQGKQLPKVVRYVVPESYSSKAYSFQDSHGVRSTLKALTDQNIPNSDIISEDGEEKEIRFIASCSSIYVKEQLLKGYPRDYKAQDTDMLRMENGLLVCYPPTESNKYEFLEKTNRNGTNKNRKVSSKVLFMFDDTVKVQKTALDQDRLITKAKSIIYQIETDEAKLRNVAAQLTLDMNADPQSLIVSLKTIAEKSPKLIIDAFDENKGDVAAAVWDGIENHILAFNGFGFSWAESGEKITVPNMRGRQEEANARKKLSDFLATEEGDSTRHLLETLIKKSKS